MTKSPDIHFIFDRRAVVMPGERTANEFSSSKFAPFLRFFMTDESELAFVNHKEPVPYNTTYELVDRLDQAGIQSNKINVFVLPWCRPYLMQEEMRTVIKQLHTLQDVHSNVVILADYSHESMIPGAMGHDFFENVIPDSGYDCSRYICAMLSMKNTNMKNVMGFKKIIPTWNFVSSTIAEMMIGDPDLPHRMAGARGKIGDIKYLVPNRVGRWHRKMFITMMYHADMLDDTEWSMVLPEIDHYENFPTYPEVEEYNRLFGTAPRSMSHPWKHWSGAKRQSVDPNQTLPMDLASLTHVYIANDTFVDFALSNEGTLVSRPDDPNKELEVFDISEKVVKPFIYGIPAFMNNRKGTVNHLRSLGFWMPGGNYNEIDDVRERMSALIQEVKVFEDEYSDETVEHLLRNRNIILDKMFHVEQSANLFEAIINECSG